MKKTNFYILLAILLITAACNKDIRQNLDLKDVNYPVVNLPTTLGVVYLSDTTIRIEPEITQNVAQNENNLRFEWGYSPTSIPWARIQPTETSTERFFDLTISVDAPVFSHFFWLEVTDNLTGITYPFFTQLTVIRPFTTVWTILHSVDGSPAILGAVEYATNLEHPVVHSDLFERFGHTPLTGAPVMLARNAADNSTLEGGYAPTVRNTLFLLTSNPEESTVYLPSAFFRPYMEGVFIPNMIYNYADANFDMSAVKHISRTEGGGGAVTNDGRFFVIRNGMKWYEVTKVAADAQGEHPIRIDKALQVGSITLMFDGANRQFVYHVNAGVNVGGYDGGHPEVGNFSDNENPGEITGMDRPVNPDSISLRNIPHNVLHIGVGSRVRPDLYMQVRSFAIALGQNGNTFVYLFPIAGNIWNGSEFQSIEEVRELATPAGLDENSLFASSTAFHNIAFFTSGSNVYRLDFSTGAASRIYSHPGGGEIAVMRMATPESTQANNFRAAYGHSTEHSLGLAINRAGRGELVVLNLNAAGEVVTTAIHEGFGAITDICFL